LSLIFSKKGETIEFSKLETNKLHIFSLIGLDKNCTAYIP